MIEQAITDYVTQLSPDLKGTVLFKDGKFYLKNCTETCVITELPDHLGLVDSSIFYSEKAKKELKKLVGKDISAVGIKTNGCIFIRNYVEL